jgi:hypothetical protein
MIHQAQWATVSVGDFFQGYNWRGTAPVLESSVTEDSLSDLPSLLCLPVSDFFAEGNWSGRRSNTASSLSDPQRPSVPAQALSITATVRDFCRGIDWRGSGMLPAPVATSPVSPAAPPAIAKPDPSIGLSDLSELF